MSIKCLSFDDYIDEGGKAIMRCTTLEKDYEAWEQYHNALVTILERYGSVSSSPDPLPDFYHSGDWFDTYTDGFAICNCKIMSDQLLSSLQSCVVATDPGATVEFCGIEGIVDGLQVLVTSDGSFAYWSDKSVRECRERLTELGLAL